MALTIPTFFPVAPPLWNRFPTGASRALFGKLQAGFGGGATKSQPSSGNVGCGGGQEMLRDDFALPGLSALPSKHSFRDLIRSG